MRRHLRKNFRPARQSFGRPTQHLRLLQRCYSRYVPKGRPGRFRREEVVGPQLQTNEVSQTPASRPASESDASRETKGGTNADHWRSQSFRMSLQRPFRLHALFASIGAPAPACVRPTKRATSNQQPNRPATARAAHFISALLVLAT
jgi:hypothetical protein